MELQLVRGMTREDLIPGLVKSDDGIGAELGVWQGAFSSYILNNWGGTLLMVDIWREQDHETYFDIMNQPQVLQDQAMQKAINAVLRFQGRYQIKRMTTVDAAKDVEDNSLEFVYIDANHSYEATYADLVAWYPKVKPGCLVAGHDFLDSENNCGSRFGVVKAVTEFTAEMPIVLRYSDETWPNWWFFKESV